MVTLLLVTSLGLFNRFPAPGKVIQDMPSLLYCTLTVEIVPTVVQVIVLVSPTTQFNPVVGLVTLNLPMILRLSAVLIKLFITGSVLSVIRILANGVVVFGLILSNTVQPTLLLSKLQVVPAPTL